jgi:hypothetical protein
VLAGEEFDLTFFCTHPDPSLWPLRFSIMFHGPSRQTALPDSFIEGNQTAIPPRFYATMLARWTINDPGEYLVYAYPEFVYCAQWMDMEYPWYMASVHVSPFKLTVLPNDGAVLEDGYEECTGSEGDHGRYLSTSSSQLARFYYSRREFAWAPYNCKIPPRTVRDAIEAIPSAKHVVFVGDSTMRGPYCSQIWEGIHGDVEGTICDYKALRREYYDTRWGHKTTSSLFNNGERNVSFTFLWSPRNFSEVARTFRSLDSPTHIIFNVGV